MEISNDLNELIDKIHNGELNINGQEPFIGILLKGLLYKLNSEIKIRNKSVPHLILHTGDDRMWLETKGYNAAIEPLTISNENSVYSIIPKCIVTPGNIDLDVVQLSSPYSQGILQYESENGDIYTFAGEFRRMPIKIGIDLQYYTNSYSDMLELIQYIVSCLAFVRTFDIIYMGQKIKCSYKIPESFGSEHTMEIDGSLSDVREHKLTLSLEVESNMPIYNNKTIISPLYISETSTTVNLKNLENDEEYNVNNNIHTQNNITIK